MRLMSRSCFVPKTRDIRLRTIAPLLLSLPERGFPWGSRTRSRLPHLPHTVKPQEREAAGVQDIGRQSQLAGTAELKILQVIPQPPCPRPAVYGWDAGPVKADSPI